MQRRLLYDLRETKTPDPFTLSDVEWLGTNPDLVPLRSRQDFRQLLSGLEKHSEPAPSPAKEQRQAEEPSQQADGDRD